MPRARWLLLAGLLVAVAAAPAQPPAKDKTPPSKEEVDPNARPVKPPPRIEDDPKPEPPPPPPQGPGVPPPPGVLVVGVRSLPELMSPAFARSDSERMALDLIFEGLLRPGVDVAAGRVYGPALARGLPRIVPKGRDVTLADAAWADPHQPDAHPPVTANDVRDTVDKLKRRAGQPGAEVADQIQSVSIPNTPQQCRITFERGQIDPLALLTFRLLPQGRADDLTFARKPIGSGPFMYAGRETKGGREYAVFPVNPAYARRDPPNLPRVKAVWMVASGNLAADFKGGLFHFALTSYTGELAVLKPAKPAGDEARQTGKLEVIIGNAGRVDTLASRRIYFLAINHKVPTLGGDRGRDLRRMLAFSIQRDAILTACFRAGFAEHHQPLNGPFPPDNWPCNPLAGQLDDANLARRLAADRRGARLELDLKYPGGDPAVAEACKLIARQVADVNGGVTIVPKAVDPADYHQTVFLNRDFRLALWHYDYPDEWFGQGGLFAFDPAAQGHLGRNFLGYNPSAEVKALLARCQDRRDFAAVRTAMRQWHMEFLKEMPVVPLWHLDTHALLAAGLTTVPQAGLLDPLAPFTHIEQWAVK